MGQLHLPLHSAPILLFSELKMMRTQVAIVFFLAVAALAEESIISYDAEDHKHEQSGDAGNAVQGSYSHTDAEGNTYTVTYVADENGYRAEGGHLPVAPSAGGGRSRSCLRCRGASSKNCHCRRTTASALLWPSCANCLPRAVCLQLRLRRGSPVQLRLRLQPPRIPIRLLSFFFY